MNRYLSREVGPLVPQERDVQQALAYHYTDQDASRQDRVPVALLWQRYVNWWLSQRSHQHRRLTRKQFGYAVRRVYPGIWRDRAMLNGRRFYVYRRLRAD